MIGDWIRTERTKRGWTREELAEKVGTSAEYIRHLEANRRLALPGHAAKVRGQHG